MSPSIRIGTFTTICLGYLLASLAIYALSAFTIAAWLFYIPILLPFYLLCLAHVISLGVKHRHKSMRYPKIGLYPIALFQILTIFSSPASCYGFKQGNACYSFIQSMFTHGSLASLENTLPHWSFVDSLFPVALFLYIIAVGVFLALIQVEN